VPKVKEIQGESQKLSTTLMLPPLVFWRVWKVIQPSTPRRLQYHWRYWLTAAVMEL